MAVDFKQNELQLGTYGRVTTEGWLASSLRIKLRGKSEWKIWGIGGEGMKLSGQIFCFDHPQMVGEFWGLGYFAPLICSLRAPCASAQFLLPRCVKSKTWPWGNQNGPPKYCTKPHNIYWYPRQQGKWLMKQISVVPFCVRHKIKSYYLVGATAYFRGLQSRIWWTAR